MMYPSGLRGFDAWLTREPDWGPEYVQPHCTECGGFLKREPDRTEPWEEGFHCDGSETFHDEPYTEGLIAILGEEYRDQTYRISVSPCGIDRGPHAPHYEVMAGGLEYTRICGRCGQVNMEREL